MKKIKAIINSTCLIIIVFVIGCKQPDDKKKTPVLTPQQIQQQATKVVGVARIEPENGIIDLKAGTDGKIISLLVKENDVVKKGQLLAVTDNSIYEAQLTQSAAKLQTQQAVIKTAQAQSTTIKTDWENAQRNYELNKKLFASKALTQDELDNSLYKMNKLQKDFEKTLADINQAKAKIGELNADINYYKTNLNQKRITASADGKILSLDVKAGYYVSANAKLGDFAPAGDIIAVTEVDEIFADRVSPGMKAEVQSQSTGEVLGKGEIVFVAAYLKKKSLFEDETTKEDRRVREVHIRLEPGSKVLIGARVDCIIFLK
jgi:HlyD family secretion protein